MAYLLDTNVFIEAKNRYYGFDICPGFWDWLVIENTAGRVSSIEKVGDEIRAADDPFLEGADYYLVAQALAQGHVVVTQEVPADTVRKVKIPNACIGLGVRHVNLFEMLRASRARFVLER